jgi:hypothetical protein
MGCPEEDSITGGGNFPLNTESFDKSLGPGEGVLKNLSNVTKLLATDIDETGNSTWIAIPFPLACEVLKEVAKRE